MDPIRPMVSLIYEVAIQRPVLPTNVALVVTFRKSPSQDWRESKVAHRSI